MWVCNSTDNYANTEGKVFIRPQILYTFALNIGIYGYIYYTTE